MPDSEDSWRRADAYEYYMGRWSRLVAGEFIDWLLPSPGLRWLDVGCGSGALSEAILNMCAPAELTAIDQSNHFVMEAQRRLGDRAQCFVGNALSLPVGDASADFVVSGLVLNFVSEPLTALAEMKRVTSLGGTVGVYVWDYSGQMEFLNHFWDAVVAIVPEAFPMREGYRFPSTTEEAMRGMFADAGYDNIDTLPIDIHTLFRNFDDYWEPFLGGQGPAPTYLMSLNDIKRQRIRDLLVERLPIQSDGTIPLQARAWAVKGKRV